MIARICKEPLPVLECTDFDFSAIINKCIRFNPEDRYSSMEDVAVELQRFLNHEAVAAAKPSVFHRFHLWAKRKPSAAALSLLGVILFLAFIFALSIGFIRTNAALKLAEKNAATADATLSDIFSHIERQTPTSSGSELLSRLLPYYQEIAEQRNLSKSQISEANRIVGTAAMRSGDYALAEKAFTRVVESSPNAFAMNQLAEALRRQGKTQSADQISRKVVEKYPNDYEAVCALQVLGEHQKAFERIHTFLKSDPKNPEYRFQYAILLGFHPKDFRSTRIAGVEPNALILLNELTEEYPDRPEYGLALVDLMSRKLYYAKQFKEKDWQELDLVLSLSDQLLGRFPNTPSVVTSVVELRKEYIFWLYRNENQNVGRKETERLQGMLEILFYNPETPDAAKESLLTMQMERLERVAAAKKNDAFGQLAAKIRGELQKYHGIRSKEFQETLTKLTRAVNEENSIPEND